MLDGEVVVIVDEEVEGMLVLVVVVRVEGAEEVEVVLWVVEVVEVEVVVGGSVEVGVGLELELEVDDVEVVSDEVGLVVVVSTVVDGSLLVVVVGVAGVDVEAGSGWVVELPSRLAIFNRVAMDSSSSCRASAALMSVGKIPSRNFLDRACRAS